jgi:hypothetical protein
VRSRWGPPPPAGFAPEPPFEDSAEPLPDDANMGVLAWTARFPSREVYEGDEAPYVEYQRIALTESVPFEEYVKGLDV